jgi:anti-sigma regulatory factor (Ser/Thr protein kinase)
MTEKSQIKHSLMLAIDEGIAGPVATVASNFGLGRQTVSKYMQELIQAGQVSISGKGKSTKYKLIEQELTRRFPLNGGLAEDLVWREVSPYFEDVSNTERGMLQYGFTEMVNNAIEHSEGKVLSVVVLKSGVKIAMMVKDDGVGIFEKISKALNLSDPRQSLIELSKGKLTTDPQRHTGEGIFFTSRMFDFFSLSAGELALIHKESSDREEPSDDWLTEIPSETHTGTVVLMRLKLPSTKTLDQVFNKYSSGPDDYSFAKTHVPLSLARYGRDELVARSQARRILSRVDKFAEVMLDFNGVDNIGQAFADEIFRVFVLQHPGTEVRYMSANPNVESMIRRATTNRFFGVDEDYKTTSNGG